MRRYLFLGLVASVALLGCEGARNNSSWSGQKESAEIVPSVKQTARHDAATPDSTAAESGAADTTQAKH